MKPTPLYRRKSRRSLRNGHAPSPKAGTVRIAETDESCAAVAAVSSHHSQTAAKTLGAYYTDGGIAEFLTRWSIRSASDRLLDPSSGGGAFLTAAASYLKELHGQPAAQICGVEVDAGTCARVSSHFIGTAGWTPRMHCEDFFALRPERLGHFDAVVGNPPFIRYQQFGGAVRDRALACAARQSVKLNRLCSSWAPFVVHASAFVSAGGRLAMVLPQELLHAAYAAPVLRHLANSFRRISILTFKEKLFPDLSENTVLVLGEEKADNARGEVRVLDSDRADALFATAQQALWDEGEQVSMEILRGERRAIEQLLPPKVRQLYHALRASDEFSTLGALADVGIGYVSGANGFFHPSAAAIEQFSIPNNLLLRAVRRGGALSGLRFTLNDWEAANRRGDASMLLHMTKPQSDLPEGVRAYLATGREKGIDHRYKCRVRKQWYSVPHVYIGDAFLTYMSGMRPRIAANNAQAVATNTLHVLRLKSNSPSAESIAAAWLTSLTSLSVEIEGHALGGGMLKLEPTEAERVILPATFAPADLPHDFGEEAADTLFLRSAGLSAAEIRSLRDSARLLRERRGIREVS